MGAPKKYRRAKRFNTFTGHKGLYTRIMQDKVWKRDEKTIETHREVWSIYTKHPRAEARRIIMENYSVSYRQANRMIEAANEFFVDSTNSDVERVRMIHRLEAEVYNSKNPAELRLGFEKLLASIQGFTKSETKKDLVRPLPQISYDSDPSALIDYPEAGDEAENEDEDE